MNASSKRSRRIRAAVCQTFCVRVIGVVGVGLNAVQGAVLAGARLIVCIDLIEAGLTAARNLAATHTCNSSEQDVEAVVADLTGGRGAITSSSPRRRSQRCSRHCRARRGAEGVALPR